MSGFGKWYEEKKNEENGDSDAGWFGNAGDQLLPLFNPENLQNLQAPSFAGMKQAMENQMPKKILGMGYQQRFQVGATCLVS